MFFKVILITIGCSVAEQLSAGLVISEAQSKSHTRTTSWMCSQQSRVQPLGHTCKTASWFVSYQLEFLTT